MLDQPFVQRVELVGGGGKVLQPLPLDDRRLEQAGGGVGIVFQQLWRAGPVPGEVEAAVERRLTPLATGLNEVGGEAGDAHVRQHIVGNHMLHRRQAQAMQLLTRIFQRVDLVGGETPIGALVPIGGAVDGMEVEPQSLDAVAPVRPGRPEDALHRPYELTPWTAWPKPPRVTERMFPDEVSTHSLPLEM